MYLSPNQDERSIVDATAQTLATEAPFERWFLPKTDAAAEEARLLKLGCELGWTGTTLHGDASVVDEMLVFRELGRRIVPIGLTAAAIGALVAQRGGNDDLAVGIVEGQISLALRCGEILLAYASATHAISVSGRRLSLVRLAQPASRTAALDWTVTTGRIRESQCEPVMTLDDEGLALRFLLLVGAQQQGIAQAALDESVGYAKIREQFGRAIGSFQAIRHKCVDMAVRAERSRAQLYFASVAQRDGRSDARIQTEAALVLARDAAGANARVNIFIHGAMGVTTENAGHLLLKRAMLWESAIEPMAASLDRISAAPKPVL